MPGERTDPDSTLPPLETPTDPSLSAQVPVLEQTVAAGGDGAGLEGRVVGTYRLIEQVGAGGMGVVYRAEHVTLGRQVAIKLLRDMGPAQRELVLRTFREARAVNQIGHPNIIDIVDFVQGDPTYLVMEYLRGEDLATRIGRGGALTPAEALAIIDPVLDALAAAHECGILHRDVKCENIFLHQDARGQQVVKLLDFGLAKILDDKGPRDLTVTGQLLGTPDYMAPEQIVGRQVDARADLYAVGVVLYHMLSGKLPFSTPSSADGPAVLVRRLGEAPPTSIPAPAGAPVPAALETVVLRCLRKDPAGRHASARELQDALRAAVREAGPVEPRQPRPTVRSSPTSARKPRDLRRLWTTGLPVLLIAVGGALLLHWILARPAARPPASVADRGPSAVIRPPDLLHITRTLDVRPAHPRPVPRRPVTPARSVAIQVTAGDASDQPLNAQVIVDGKPAGRTPLRVEVVLGRPHLLEVSSPGYARQRRKVVPPPNGTSVHFELRPR
jgi:serine/threonine protein kinase